MEDMAEGSESAVEDNACVQGHDAQQANADDGGAVAHRCSDVGRHCRDAGGALVQEILGGEEVGLLRGQSGCT